MVEPVEHKLVDGLLEVHEVENHPLRVRLALEHDAQMIRMAVQPFALAVIMYEIMRRIKLEVPAQQHCAIPPECILSPYSTTRGAPFQRQSAFSTIPQSAWPISMCISCILGV